MKWHYLLALIALAIGSRPSALFAENIPDHREIATSTVVITAAAITTTERDYRWYVNENALTPTVPLGAENAATTTPISGDVLRLRINVGVSGLSLPTGATFLLQYATGSGGPWDNLSTSTSWIFFDNPGVADGAIIVTTVLSATDAGESYGESNPSAASPNTILASQEGEWDWVVRNNAAATSSDWYFRMIFSSGTVFDTYTNYPRLTAAPSSTPGGGGGSSTGTISGGSSPGLGLGIGLLPLPVPTGTPPESRPPSPCDSLILQRVDLSGDCLVDIVDLSILVFYYEERGPRISRFDFNDDGVVELADVSVMMYYWTT